MIWFDSIPVVALSGGGVRSKPLYGRTHCPLVGVQGLFVVNYGENRIRVRGLFFILRGVYTFFW